MTIKPELHISVRAAPLELLLDKQFEASSNQAVKDAEEAIEKYAQAKKIIIKFIVAGCGNSTDFHLQQEAMLEAIKLIK